jgi:hypothetical protein
MANYSGSRISQCVANDGDTLSGHNFCQEQPYTPILEGLTGLTFVDCNLVNCKVPAGSTIISSNISQIDRCSHLQAEARSPRHHAGGSNQRSDPPGSK